MYSKAACGPVSGPEMSQETRYCRLRSAVPDSLKEGPPVRYWAWQVKVAAGGVLLCLLWLSLALPGLIWHGIVVLEPCDQALADRHETSIGNIVAKRLGSYWSLDSRWHCKYRLTDTGEIVEVTVRGW